MRVRDLYDLVERDYAMNGKTSLKACRHHFAPVLARFGEMDADLVTTADVEKYQFDRLAQGKARQTINNETCYLRRGYKLAIRLEKLTRAPLILNLRVDNARSGFLRPEEFMRLFTTLETLSHVVSEITCWLYLLGWRSEEIKALTWDECDQEAGTVQLPARRSKNRKPRRIKLPPELHASLRRRWLQKDGPYVFHRKGKRVRSFRGVWDRARKAIGRPSLIPHDLRRSFCTNGIQAGLAEKTIMGLGGWLTSATFARYVIVHEELIEQALAKLADYATGKRKLGP